MKTKKKTLKQKLKSQARKIKAKRRGAIKAKRAEEDYAKVKAVSSVFEKNPFNWVSIGDDWCLSVNKDIEFWIIKLCANYALIQFEVNECIVRNLSPFAFCLSDALRFHEDYLRKELDENGSSGFFGFKNAKWRLVPASPSQKSSLRDGDVSFSSTITKGDACDLLTRLYSFRPKIDEDDYMQPSGVSKYLSNTEATIESMIGKDHYSEFAAAEESRQKDEKNRAKTTPITNPERQTMEKLDIWSKEEIEHIFKLQLQYASTSTKNTAI